MTMRLLIVEDDDPLRELLARGLREGGHTVDALSDGRTMRAYLDATPYDAIVLDVNMPFVDGFQLLRGLRAEGVRTPALLLTARDGVADIITGLDAGADDYLRKPFVFAELEARLRSVVRRPPTWRENLLRAGDIEMDVATRRVERAGREIVLTAKEGAFLEILMRHVHQTVMRRTIEEQLWDLEKERTSNVLDVYARRLRAKLSEGGETQVIHTVRGIGYRLDALE